MSQTNTGAREWKGRLTVPHARVFNTAFAMMNPMQETQGSGHVRDAGGTGNCVLPTSSPAVRTATGRVDPLYTCCVHTLFERQVERTPSSIAAVCGSAHLTYLDLNAQANQLAHYLQSLGVGPEVPVGVHLEPSLEGVIAVLGILKAGGAYVPLDPNQPKDRLAFMLSDAGVALVISQRSLARRSGLDTQAQPVYLDSVKEHLLRQNRENMGSKASPENLAYVLYTSGSTGRPKGVAVPQGALTNLLLSMGLLLEVTEHDVFLALTTLAFDVAALELFLPLLVGARTIIVRRERAMGVACLVSDLAQYPITIMQATPSAWRLLLDSGWSGTPNLKILSGGEVLPRSLAHELLNHCACLWNGYGPTETTIYATAFRVMRGQGSVPIGYPLAGAQLHVLDDQFCPVACGEVGELYIGGPGVARGYLNRPELTRERFIPDPFSATPGARLYRTGDLVCTRPDGALEYHGRMDRQIKLRGYRIEPGEIEEVLRQHPSISDARVVAHTYGLEDRRLVAYIICRPEDPLRIQDIRAHAQRWLPGYMLPAAYVPLQAFPLLPNGKVDYRALPDPVLQCAATQEQPSSANSPLEERLMAIWSEVLQGAVCSVDESFFDLGGNSLLVARVLARVQAAFTIELPLSALFEAPTIAEFSGRVQSALSERYNSSTTGQTMIWSSPANGSMTSGPLHTTADAGLEEEPDVRLSK